MSASLIHRSQNGPHLTITLDDPKRQNALSRDMVVEFERALDDSRAARLSSLVIKGANHVFSAGADLKSLSDALARSLGPGESDPLQDLNRAGGEFFAKLNAHPAATIAIVDGAAVGGGVGLACCADIVIATPRARFALAETSLGFPPAQIAPYLVARLGERVARRLALTGARLDGREAVAIGLADFYCDTEPELGAQLRTLLNQIARCAPGANAETKRLILSERVGAAYVDEAAASFARALRGPEGREGVSAFLEKRAPRWAERLT